MLNKEKIIDELNKLGIPPIEIHFYECTDSTNTRAKEWAKQSAEKRPAVFIANEQSAGRGRLGRSFVSERGAGIYMSILTYPDERGADATEATARAAVSLARATESLVDCEIRIKWVNDLYLAGKKLAGILTEGEMGNDGQIAYQIVGMGINVYKNAISDEISDIATSIECETNHKIDRSRLVAKIISEFMSDRADYYDEYKARSFIIGKNVTVVKLTESYKAKVVNIDSDFSLIIERDGITERLFTGEISLRI